jgi:hypothetical protein
MGLFGVAMGRMHDKDQEKLREDSSPFRSPPSTDFIFFSESARSIAACVELNDEAGLFVGPAKPRMHSLAVIEAMTEQREACDVRIIGKVDQVVTRPSKMVRVRWMRAVSPLPPDRFLDMLGEYYGFSVPLDVTGLTKEQYPNGVEYDFSRRLLTPRGLDSARGDSGDRRKAEPPTRKYQSEEQVELREKMGMDTTQSFLKPLPDDFQFED